MTNDFVVQAGCKLGTSILVGIGAAGAVGVTPVVGTTMAAVAFLTSCLAIEGLKALPSFEDEGLSHKTLGTFCLFVSWDITVTQISQIFARVFLFTSLPFFPSFVIVTSALVLGSEIFGKLLANQVTGQA